MTTIVSKSGLRPGESEALHFIGKRECPDILAYLKKIALDQTGERFSVPSINQLAKLFRSDEITIIDALNDLMMEGYDYTAEDPESPVIFTKAPSKEMLRRFRWWNWPSLYRYGMTESV